ncbi:hypothetical protein ACWEQV_25790 [Rhodococcus aetherivorans]|nr:hypothetical protein [Rhodococcus zopfii]
MAGKSIEVLRADYAAAVANGSDEEFATAKTALVEATTGRTLTADEIAYF